MALKILLADDNITAQKMGSKILTDAGHEVIAVSNGAAAVKKIASEKPDLLILDIYMPGYSGLEVCEKVKNSLETAHMPVLLTVTNMEPFNPEDSQRVKADGVMIKPFEASDLMAVAEKFEHKIESAKSAPAAAEIPDTVKIPVIEEFKDASYEDWKSEAPPNTGAEQPRISVPQEIAVSPALGFDEFTVSEPLSVLPPFEMAAPAPVVGEEYGTDNVLELAPEPAVQHAAETEIAPAPGLEYTSAPQAAEVEVAPAPELELASEPGPPEIPIVQDAALVTTPEEMAQFTTKFGEEHPEEIAVGIAMPGLGPEPVSEPAVEPAAEAEVPADLVAEAVPMKTDSAAGFAVSTGGAAAAPALEPLPEPPHDELVGQFAAELDQATQERAAAQPQPQAEPAMDMQAAQPSPEAEEEKISAAVDKVLERYREELVAAIIRELKG